MSGAAMARERKPIELRPVEEAPIREEEIVRLEKDAVVVKVVQERVETRPAPEARLEVPDHSEAETKRTHEPGVEVLIEGETATSLADEHSWGSTEAAKNPLPWGWFALLGVALAGAVVWSVSRMVEGKGEVTEARQEADTKVTTAEMSDDKLAAQLDRLEAVVRKYCEASTVEEMARWVRHSERVRPLMDKYYAANPLQPLGFRRQKDFQGAMLGAKTSFWVVKVETGAGKTKALLVEEAEDGTFGVDWETAVVYQPMPWDEYAKTRPKGSRLDFRVHVTRDNFFSHEFANADQWACYRLNIPGSEETLWGYVPKGGQRDMILANLLDHNPDPNKAAAVVLRLSLPEQLESRRGVIIDKVLSTRWLYIETPED